jgi:hypothetical protein
MSDGSFKGKISGFDVLWFGTALDARLRCFAIVSEPHLPNGKEIQVITDELPLQLALALGSTLKCQVEVEFDDDDGINRLSRVRMLDR